MAHRDARFHRDLTAAEASWRVVDRSTSLVALSFSCILGPPYLPRFPVDRDDHVDATCGTGTRRYLGEDLRSARDDALHRVVTRVQAKPN